LNLRKKREKKNQESKKEEEIEKQNGKVEKRSTKANEKERGLEALRDRMGSTNISP